MRYKESVCDIKIFFYTIYGFYPCPGYTSVGLEGIANLKTWITEYKSVNYHFAVKKNQFSRHYTKLRNAHLRNKKKILSCALTNQRHAPALLTFIICSRALMHSQIRKKNTPKRKMKNPFLTYGYARQGHNLLRVRQVQHLRLLLPVLATERRLRD